MANIKTLNKRRMNPKIPGSQAKPPATSSDILTRALRGGDSMSLPRVGTGEPSGGPLAKQGSRAVAERATPRGERFMGDAQRVGTKTLPASRAPATPKAAPAAVSRGLGLATRGLGAAGLMAYSPAVGEGSDKPRNYPGEGLRAAGAFPQGKAESSIPAPKKAAPAAPKPRPRPARSSAEDDFMADLRASASKMKEATSEAAGATGRMKGAMEEFQSAATDADEGYKRGGHVGGRGDGRAIRGRTKGRFI